MRTDKPFATPDAWQRLLAAAKALLDARTDQMVTASEWQALRQAVTACDPQAAQRLEESEDA
jgi:hypothetical protein